MYAEGWRRLWELLKWLTAIGAGVWSASVGIPALEAEAVRTPLTPGQMMFALLLMTTVPAGVIFAFLSSLEWVYRGFHPLPKAPPPKEPSESEAEAPGLVPHQALPSPTPKQASDSGELVAVRDGEVEPSREASLHR